MQKHVIRGAMHEVLPFLGECYGDARDDTLRRLPGDPRALHAHRRSGHRHRVDVNQLFDDNKQAMPSKLDDCVRGTLQTLELPPLGDDDTIEVDCPLFFSDGDGGGSVAQRG